MGYDYNVSDSVHERINEMLQATLDGLERGKDDEWYSKQWLFYQNFATWITGKVYTIDRSSGKWLLKVS